MQFVGAPAGTTAGAEFKGKFEFLGKYKFGCV